MLFFFECIEFDYYILLVFIQPTIDLLKRLVAIFIPISRIIKAKIKPIVSVELARIPI